MASFSRTSNSDLATMPSGLSRSNWQLLRGVVANRKSQLANSPNRVRRSTAAFAESTRADRGAAGNSNVRC